MERILEHTTLFDKYADIIHPDKRQGLRTMMEEAVKDNKFTLEEDIQILYQMAEGGQGKIFYAIAK